MKVELYNLLTSRRSVLKGAASAAALGATGGLTSMLRLVPFGFACRVTPPRPSRTSDRTALRGETSRHGAWDRARAALVSSEDDDCGITGGELMTDDTRSVIGEWTRGR